MGGKLPGLFGDCSGGRHSTTCFSARLMWREKGDGEIYVYMPDQAAGFYERKDFAIINGLFFSPIFGGGSPPWASRLDCYSYFKDFIISEGAEVPIIG
ncbi:uncharacterized protein LOC126828082 [Patella vulgata]|uniref:uncharacterized protein LOC126828082 n=1 Tax=Patella vulgata TaxID=6465 RepID=UPI00217F9F5C|nr:uncharacterized protein LOC126828082 [Patella vulgata]